MKKIILFLVLSAASFYNVVAGDIVSRFNAQLKSGQSIEELGKTSGGIDILLGYVKKLPPMTEAEFKELKTALALQMSKKITVAPYTSAWSYFKRFDDLHDSVVSTGTGASGGAGTGASGGAGTGSYVSFTQELLKDPAIQATMKMLNDNVLDPSALSKAPEGRTGFNLQWVSKDNSFKEADLRTGKELDAVFELLVNALNANISINKTLGKIAQYKVVLISASIAQRIAKLKVSKSITSIAPCPFYYLKLAFAYLYPQVAVTQADGSIKMEQKARFGLKDGGELVTIQDPENVMKLWQELVTSGIACEYNATSSGGAAGPTTPLVPAGGVDMEKVKNLVDAWKGSNPEAKSIKDYELRGLIGRAFSADASARIELNANFNSYLAAVKDALSGKGMPSTGGTSGSVSQDPHLVQAVIVADKLLNNLGISSATSSSGGGDVAVTLPATVDAALIKYLRQLAASAPLERVKMQMGSDGKNAEAIALVSQFAHATVDAIKAVIAASASADSGGAGSATPPSGTGTSSGTGDSEVNDVVAAYRKAQVAPPMMKALVIGKVKKDYDALTDSQKALVVAQIGAAPIWK